jgi:hypothetical protein
VSRALFATAGVRTTIDVALTLWIEAAKLLPPELKLTATGPWKSMPLTVTWVFPLCGPLEGVAPVITGLVTL